MVVLVHHEVVLNFAILVVHTRADQRAAIIFAAHRSLKPASVNLQDDVFADFWSLNRHYFKCIRLVYLFLRDDLGS